jgi:hypothetical protein
VWVGADRESVSSFVIANDPDSSQPEVVSTLVITNVPSEYRQRRQICTSGVLPPLTGGSLICQMRRQLEIKSHPPAANLATDDHVHSDRIASGGRKDLADHVRGPAQQGGVL